MTFQSESNFPTTRRDTGGQLEPAIGGQLEPAIGGQLEPAIGGQLETSYWWTA